MNFFMTLFRYPFAEKSRAQIDDDVVQIVHLRAAKGDDSNSGIDCQKSLCRAVAENIREPKAAFFKVPAQQLRVLLASLAFGFEP